MSRPSSAFALAVRALVCLLPFLIVSKTSADEQQKLFAIEGRLVDARGNPVSEIEVMLLQHAFVQGNTRMIASKPASMDGRFVFERVSEISEARHGRGAYAIVAMKDGMPVAYQQLSHETAFPIVMQVDIREAGKVTGVVLGPDRQPQAGVSVAVEVIAGDRRPGVRHGRSFSYFAMSGIGPFHSTTDATGRFEFAKLPKGMEVRFVVEHSAFARQRVNCTPPSAVEVHLEPGAVLQGQVLYSDTNLPAANALVAVEHYRRAGDGSLPQGASTIADREGRYKIESLKPGRYNVWADQEGWTIHAQEGYDLKAGESNPSLFLNLIRGGIIKGRILDEKGMPVSPGERSNIQWSVPARPITGLSMQFARINPDGSFELRAAPGENRLSFVLTGAWKPAAGNGRIVNIAEGETVEIQYVVKPK